MRASHQLMYHYQLRIALFQALSVMMVTNYMIRELIHAIAVLQILQDLLENLPTLELYILIQTKSRYRQRQIAMAKLRSYTLPPYPVQVVSEYLAKTKSS